MLSFPFGILSLFTKLNSHKMRSSHGSDCLIMLSFFRCNSMVDSFNLKLWIVELQISILHTSNKWKFKYLANLLCGRTEISHGYLFRLICSAALLFGLSDSLLDVDFGFYFIDVHNAHRKLISLNENWKQKGFNYASITVYRRVFTRARACIWNDNAIWPCDHFLISLLTY